jgi:hypothetical protein
MIRIMISSPSLSMIVSESRFPLFRIMRWSYRVITALSPHSEELGEAKRLEGSGPDSGIGLMVLKAMQRIAERWRLRASSP